MFYSVYAFLSVFMRVCVFLMRFVCEITQVGLKLHEFDRKDDLLVDNCPPAGAFFVRQNTRPQIC